MGKVSDYFVNLVKNHVRNKGLIVWYDPEHNYEKYLSSFDFGSIPLFKYEGSYFKLRKDIDRYLSGKEPEKCIVYIPLERKKGASPMIEAESAGQVIEPGGVSGANTRLEVIARGALANILSHSSVEEICKSVAKGAFTLEDLDKMAETGEESRSGAITLIFGTVSANEVALKFLSSSKYDTTLKEKNALSELIDLLNIAYGFASNNKETDAVRKELVRYILLTEFLSYITDKSIHKIFEHTPHALKEAYKDACRQLAIMWRNRADLKEMYEESSLETEKALSIYDLKLYPEEIIHCNTFEYIEKILHQYVCELILSDKLSQASSVIEYRKLSFWTMADPVGILRWNLLDTVVKLIGKAFDIRKELKDTGLNHIEIIENYVKDKKESEGWYILDYYHRLLERHYSTYDEGLSEESEGLIIKTVSKARNEYTETIGKMTHIFLDTLVTNKFDFKRMPRQSNIFRNYLREKIQKHKTAYVLVDALRYEMGKELFDYLGEFGDKHIEFAVACAPTITDIGMVALLPGAENGITIIKSSSNDILPQISNSVLKDRKNRIEFIKQAVEGKIVDVKLEQLIKPGKKLKDQVKENDLIIVTSQEIDEIGEGDNIPLARKVMNDILNELVRALRNLNQMGIEYFVITSDHGYLFGEELTEAMKVESPGGNTIAINRRYWAGYGGNRSESFIRVTSGQLGICGDLEFAFPKGVAGFKAKGGARAYLHGGSSLEELIIPVITINAAGKEKHIEGQNVYKVIADRVKITSRFFTIKVMYKWLGLFGEKESCVHLVVKSGKNEVGKVATAVYGHKAGTSEVILEKDRENYVTLMLDEGIKDKNITVSILDSKTGRELASSENLELSLTF